MVEKEREMMKNFTVHPYTGVDEVKFGARENDVELAFGTPIRRSKNRKNETKLVYDDAEFTFSSEQSSLVEISFRRNVELMINGVNIFHDKDALMKLTKTDPPLEYVGILFFPTLGISTTGFHTSDDLSVTAVAKGRFDAVLQKFIPYKS